MSRFVKSESGHTNILAVTVLAAICLIILTFGAGQPNTALLWIGGIGAAVLLVIQFVLIHQEIGNLWGRIERLEQGRDQ